MKMFYLMSWFGHSVSVGRFGRGSFLYIYIFSKQIIADLADLTVFIRYIRLPVYKWKYKGKGEMKKKLLKYIIERISFINEKTASV